MLRTHGIAPPPVGVVLSPTDVLQLQSIAARIHVETTCSSTGGLTGFTRRIRARAGASPRATLGLLRASKSLGVLAGRPFVTPDDCASSPFPCSPTA